MTAHPFAAALHATGRALWSAARGVDAILAAFLAPIPSSIAAHEEVG